MCVSSSPTGLRRQGYRPMPSGSCFQLVTMWLREEQQPERLYDALLSVYERMGRHRDAALVSFDRELPRQL